MAGDGFDLPRTSAPAAAALESAGVRDLRDLAGRARREVASLHGMGPKALRILGDALTAAGLSWRDEASPRP